MYRDDNAARAERANALIDEIADLERQRVAHAAADQRLEAARRELSSLQTHAAAAPTPPTLGMHLLVFGAAAAAAFVAYNLVF
ncbi:MAG TPA: hypothetical protein VLM79_07075 [Kofleriaceae bacterium]|nr:hypothetical protein [Kofleriaceae bacterium]